MTARARPVPVLATSPTGNRSQFAAGSQKHRDPATSPLPSPNTMPLWQPISSTALAQLP